MAAKGEKHILRAGATDKRAITVTLYESLDGCMLPFQLIYTGKMERSLPNFTFPDGFCLAFNKKHWSSERSCYVIEAVMVPKNMTHLLQPLDLTTNASFKKYEERAFSEYFTSCIMEALKNDPDRDVLTIKIDLRLKPRHAKVMTDMYQHLKSEKGKEIIKTGWKVAGITDIKDA